MEYFFQKNHKQNFDGDHFLAEKSHYDNKDDNKSAYVIYFDLLTYKKSAKMLLTQPIIPY